MKPITFRQRLGSWSAEVVVSRTSPLFLSSERVNAKGESKCLDLNVSKCKVGRAYPTKVQLQWQFQC